MNALLVISILILSASGARADSGPTDWTKPYAVLGRGVTDRKSGAILQLACKSEPIENTQGELQCEEVQFIESDLSGNVTEIGRPMRLGVDFSSTRDLKKMLKNQVRSMKRSGELPGRALFSSTKNWITADMPPGTKALPFLIGGGLALMLATGGAPVLGVIGVSLFGAFPIGIDIILIPLGLGVGAIKGDYFIGTKTLSVYGWVRDRDPRYWQFKPRTISRKNYERFKSIVSSNPKRVIHVERVITEWADSQGNYEVEVQYKDGRVETIDHPKDLVIYVKGSEPRVYGPNGRIN